MRRYTDIETMIKQANGNRDMIFLLNDNTVAQNIAATSKKEFLREHNVVNVPRKKLKDISIQFVLDSHYSVLSKMIPDEDRWFSKDYTYTSGIWSHRYVSLIYREQTFEQ